MTTFNPCDPKETVVEAWLTGAQRLRAEGDLLNLMLHASTPSIFTDRDRAVMEMMNSHLKSKEKYGLDTVANTIFPIGLYRPGERNALYEKYRKGMPAQRKDKAGWGRYFERLIDWPVDNPERSSKKGEPIKTINQLEGIILKLKLYASTGTARANYYHAYEMALFDPRKDQLSNMGRQCLSLLELKPVPREGGSDILHMTAFYRNHHYIARTLGNMIGLSGLLSFISAESDLTPGSLTIVSSHGELDLTGAKAIVDACANVFEEAA